MAPPSRPNGKGRATVEDYNEEEGGDDQYDFARESAEPTDGRAIEQDFGLTPSRGSLRLQPAATPTTLSTRTTRVGCSAAA